MKSIVCCKATFIHLPIIILHFITVTIFKTLQFKLVVIIFFDEVVILSLFRSLLDNYLSVLVIRWCSIY